MNRREFFHPEALHPVAAPLLGLLGTPAPPPAESGGEGLLLRASRRAMATTFEIVLPYGTPGGPDAATAALGLIDDLERQLTVYRNDSEVSRLNRLAPQRPVTVEAGLFGLLQLCQSLSVATGGAFDITSGPLIKCWGFYRRQGAIPDEAARLAALSRVGMADVILDAASRSVRFGRPGMEINLGSVGKGYALDMTARSLRADGIGSALLNAGMSSILALGIPPHDPAGWLANLRSPFDPDASLGVVTLRDQALGTSANMQQRFVADGKTYGHLLDPRTGRPAEGVALATVIAPTGAEADALATAMFVAGPDLAERLCQARPDVGVILVASDPVEPLQYYGLARRQFAPSLLEPAAL